MDNNYFFHDFKKAAFATLDIEIEAKENLEVTAIIGECIKDGKVDREPGLYRYANVQKINVNVGKGVYRFPMNLRPPCRTGALISPLKDEEIAPFRYVEVIGNCKVCSVKRHEIFPKEFKDSDSHFYCSDERLNRLWEFCKYSIKATAAFGLFVDGERERQPYEGDNYVNQLGWFYCCAKADIARKTLDHLFVYPTWPTEYQLLMPVLVRDYLLYTGDYQSVEKWLPLLENSLLEKWVKEDHLLYTDVRNPKDIVDWPIGERDGYEFGDTNLVPNCFRYGALLAMFELTKNNLYQQKAQLLKEAIRKSMLKEDGFVDSPNSNHTALHSIFYPIFWGVGSIEECPSLEKAQMACSVYGAQYLLSVLFENNMAKQAMDFLTSEGKRSWLNMITLGSTITMEAWGNEYKPNQDWNHAWGAAPCNLIPRYVVGLRPLEPGFKKFIVDPHPVDLTSFYLKTPIPDNRFIEIEYKNKKLEISVPNNTIAVYNNVEYNCGHHSIDFVK
jgi:hypothetical protein